MANFAPREFFAYLDTAGNLAYAFGRDLVDRGSWKELESYFPRDVVRYENTLYTAFLPSIGLFPTAIKDRYWSALIKFGGGREAAGLSAEIWKRISLRM